MRPVTVLVWLDVPDDETTDEIRDWWKDFVRNSPAQPYIVADVDVQEER